MASSRAGEEVLGLLDRDEEEADCNDGLFFPGSDDELGFLDEEEDDGYVGINVL